VSDGASGVTEDLQEMARSQDIAAAVALKYLGLSKVGFNHGGAGRGGRCRLASGEGGLEPTDVIVAVDGSRVRTTGTVRRLITATAGRPQCGVGFRAGEGSRRGTRDVAAPARPPNGPPPRSAIVVQPHPGEAAVPGQDRHG
jgi:hypothetical protein